jgi:hypothetical protein
MPLDEFLGKAVRPKKANREKQLFSYLDVG